MASNHQSLLKSVFKQLLVKRRHNQLKVCTEDGSTYVNESILCLFSSFIRHIVSSNTNQCSESVLLLPDITLENILHLKNFLNQGFTNISTGDLANNFKNIIEDAKSLGISIDLLSAEYKEEEDSDYNTKQNV